MLAEIIQNPQSTITNHYVWGLDLSGSIQGAGGIGGLLAASLDGSTVAYCHDANGNVSQLVSPDGDLLAHYDYSPFGETVVSTGPLAKANPFRFSTKHWDDLTGLGYWGYRYYHPVMGRWLSRDPIEEDGGKHLYCVVKNNPVNENDSIGLAPGNPAKAPLPSPRWVARPYKRPNAMTIVCDGKGGVRVQIPDGTYSTDIEKKCIQPCTEQHEECHKQHALASNPDVCKGQPDGVQVGAATDEVLYVSEAVCHTKALSCIENMKKNDPDCDCLRVEQYEEHTRHYLEKYKELLRHLQKEKSKGIGT